MAAQRSEYVNVGPGAVATAEFTLKRLLTITGRVVNAESGKGIGERCRPLLPTQSERLHQSPRPGRDRRRRAVRDRHRTGPDQDSARRSSPCAISSPRSANHPTCRSRPTRSGPISSCGGQLDLDGIVVDEKGQPVAARGTSTCSSRTALGHVRKTTGP